MKKTSHLPLTLILIFISFCGIAQTTGDYRTNAATFDWSTDASWQRWNGTAWVAPTAAEGYPGETAASIAGTVTIQNGHTVRATVDVTTNDIGNLVLVGSGILNYNTNNIDIEATGNLSMDNTSQIQGTSGNRTLRIAGTFNVPASATNARIEGFTFTVIGATTVSGVLTMNNGAGVKTFSNNVTVSGNFTLSNSNHVVNIGGNLSLLGAGILNMSSNTQDVNVTGTLSMDGTSQITGGSTSRTIDAPILIIPASATNARITNVRLTITDPNITIAPIAASILGILNMSSTTATINGETLVSGTLTLSSDTGTKTFNGKVTVSGSWTSTAIVTEGRLVFGGEVLTSGAFNPGCQDQ